MQVPPPRLLSGNSHLCSANTEQQRSILPLSSRCLAGFLTEFLGAFVVSQLFLSRSIGLLDGTLRMDAGGGIRAFATYRADFAGGIRMQGKGLGIVLHDRSTFFARRTWSVQSATRLASRRG